MERQTNDEAQRKDFFTNSFRGNLSYNTGVSSVNSFLRSITRNESDSELSPENHGIPARCDIQAHRSRKLRNL